MNRDSKYKITMTGLMIALIVVVGMWLYQNVYLSGKTDVNKVTVIMAIHDIPKGTPIDNTNVGIVKVDAGLVTDQIVQRFDDVNGKKTTENIFKNDMVSKRRIEQKKTVSQQFKITIKPAFCSSIIKSDSIRIYVQIFDNKTKEIKVFLLFNNKEVKEVSYKASKDKSNTKEIGSIEIVTSDEESVNYYAASKVGEIIVVKYNDITAQDFLEVKQFELNSPEILRIRTEKEEEIVNSNALNNSTQTDDNDANSSVKATSQDVPKTKITYIVKNGETLDSIAKSFNITLEQIQKDNKGIKSVKDGMKIYLSI